MKGLTIAYILLLVIGAAIGVYFVLQKPRHVVALTGDASSETAATYQRRLDSLKFTLDTLKSALARKGKLASVATRMRISQLDEKMSDLSRSLSVWRESHNEYGVGQIYRECLLLYGGAQTACQSLSYDTLPPKPDTLHRPQP